MVEKFKPCSVDECGGNSHYAAGGVKQLCRAHYRRLYRYGDPCAGKTFKGDPFRAYIEALSCQDERCLIWGYARDYHGYGQINMDGRVQYVHRVICTVTHGHPPTASHHAAHICGNGHLGCVNPNHLRWATPLENASDKPAHGTLPLGEDHHAAKLTERDVRLIRSLRGRMTQKDIGNMLGVHKETVGNVQRRENWAWLE